MLSIANIMFIESIDSIVKNKKFPPVLLLFGKEYFLKDEAIARIIEAATEGINNDFDIETADAENNSQEQIVAMASAFPFVSDRRVVIVKNAEKLTIAKSKKKEDKIPAIVKYLQNPSQTTFLLMIADSTELDDLTTQLRNNRTKEKAEKRLTNLKEPFNTIVKHHTVIEFGSLYEREIPNWLAKRAKIEGKEISPEAIDLLVARVGTSLRELHNELQKIITYSPDKKKISLDDVMNIVGQSRTYNIFELQKAIGERNLPRAIDITLRMVSAERNEILIITMLTRYFLSLSKLLEASATTSNPMELSRSVDINSYFIPDYIAALRRYSPAELAKAFLALREADIALKTSTGHTHAIMQKMVLSIVGVH